MVVHNMSGTLRPRNSHPAIVRIYNLLAHVNRLANGNSGSQLSLKKMQLENMKRDQYFQVVMKYVILLHFNCDNNNKKNEILL